MKKRVTERQKSELARRKAMMPALIIKPLKFIAEKVNTLFRNERGTFETKEGWQFKKASRFAAMGNGTAVQQIARQFI
jgi:hypothetical protein